MLFSRIRKEISKKNLLGINLREKFNNNDRLEREREKMKRTFLRNSFCRHLTCSTGRFTYLSTCLSADLPEALSARVSSARKKGYRRGRGVVDAVPVEGLSRLCSYRLVIKSRGTGQKLG